MSLGVSEESAPFRVRLRFRIWWQVPVVTAISGSGDSYLVLADEIRASPHSVSQNQVTVPLVPPAVTSDGT